MMEDKEKAIRVVDHMMQNDKFSQWLGIEILEKEPGACRLRMKVREEMCNGFGITHGGISYSLADSALAFASNAHGRHAVSIETSIAHINPIQTGDVLTAIATESSRSNRLGRYDIRVENQNGSLVAFFRGTVFRKEQKWEV